MMIDSGAFFNKNFIIHFPLDFNFKTHVYEARTLTLCYLTVYGLLVSLYYDKDYDLYYDKVYSSMSKIMIKFKVVLNKTYETSCT